MGTQCPRPELAVLSQVLGKCSSRVGGSSGVQVIWHLHRGFRWVRLLWCDTYRCVSQSELVTDKLSLIDWLGKVGSQRDWLLINSTGLKAVFVATCYHGYRQISLHLLLWELLQFSVGIYFFLSAAKRWQDFDCV